MTEPTMISFTWGFLLKAFVLGGVTYFIWPTVFVLRCWLAKYSILKIITIGKTQDNLNKYYINKYIANELRNMRNANTPDTLKKEIDDTLLKISTETESIENEVNNISHLISWIKENFHIKNHKFGISDWMSKHERLGMTMGTQTTPEIYDQLVDETCTLSSYVNDLEEKLDHNMVKFYPK